MIDKMVVAFAYWLKVQVFKVLRRRWACAKNVQTQLARANDTRKAKAMHLLKKHARVELTF